jgi:hypothetical protein
VSVPKGATSIVLNEAVPALTTVPATTRAILLNYRMLDSSNKSSVFTYN